MPRKKKDETVEAAAVEETVIAAETANIKEAAISSDEQLLLEQTDEATETVEAETYTDSDAVSSADAKPPPEKKKRVTHKKKDETKQKAKPISVGKSKVVETADKVEDFTPPTPAKKATTKRDVPSDVLTIESGANIETEQNKEDTAWHEIHNAYLTRKILTGTLDGIEQLESGSTISIVHHGGYRILIPLKEMMINIQNASPREYEELMRRQNKILGNMLGAEIDFVIKGIDSTNRSVVASRKEAMLKKRQLFYLKPDDYGQFRVHEGRVVQARVIAVADKVVRVEVFGVECSIMARNLSWDWMGDAHERFRVGDEILVRILSVKCDDVENISITADAKSVTENTSAENLKKIRIQGKYAGQVTDIHKGVVFIRLHGGVNAVAHSCYDRKMPGKKDDVSFVVTHLDDERGVAVGIITRIIRQNL